MGIESILGGKFSILLQDFGGFFLGGGKQSDFATLSIICSKKKALTVHGDLDRLLTLK